MDINVFARQNNIEGLTVESLQSLVKSKPGYTLEKAKRFLKFNQRIHQDLLQHRIIQKNEY